MKVHGLNVTLIRGEYAALSFELVDKIGKPFIMLAPEEGDKIFIYFRVKENAFAKIPETYIINKELEFNDNVYAFDDDEIINVEEAYPSGYNPYAWNPEIVGLVARKLYYHPDLDEYAYFDDVKYEFVLYKLEIIVPFDSSETIDLDYKTYYYSIVLEVIGASGDVIYNNTLVDQHTLIITYQV